MIMKETNNYAQQVMGDEKFDKWSKVDVVSAQSSTGLQDPNGNE